MISLQLGELLINQDLLLRGPAATTLAVNGNTNGRVFNVAAGTVLISDLAITNGMVRGTNGSPGTVPGGPGGSGASAFGGGIYNHSTLTLSNCWISGNSAIGGAGGNGGADSYLIQAGNGGPGGVAAGGGIYSIGSLTLVVTNYKQVHEINIFAFVLVVQSLPFVAAYG